MKATPNEPENQPPRYYIGKDKPVVEYSTHNELHWYEAYLMGYKPKAWPKLEVDRDDDRFNLRETE